jgi:hypothetical protein
MNMKKHILLTTFLLAGPAGWVSAADGTKA